MLAVLIDERLNRLLDPFREDRPRQVYCPKDGCQGKLVSIAIDRWAAAVVTGSAEMVRGPPWGMASRALTARLMTTCSRLTWSASTGGRWAVQ